MLKTRNAFQQRKRSQWTLLCGTLIALPLVASQPNSLPSSKDEQPGRIASSAIHELLTGQPEGQAFRSMMSQRRSVVTGKPPSAQDPYMPWLSVRLAQNAAMGKLFVGTKDKVSLRVTWDMGDKEFWYIGQVSTFKADGSRALVGGPWVLWKSLGALVTPNDPEHKPWISDYELPSISEGDIVELDVYRLPRKAADRAELLDPVAVIKNDTAKLLLRLPLPVVLDERHMTEDQPKK